MHHISSEKSGLLVHGGEEVVKMMNKPPTLPTQCSGISGTGKSRVSFSDNGEKVVVETMNKHFPHITTHHNTAGSHRSAEAVRSANEREEKKTTGRSVASCERKGRREEA